MIILIFGPPGCGKGTQAAYLAERLQIPAISTGEMFRSECKAGTELGRLACATLAKGALVADDIVNRIVNSRIARPDCESGFLLDGYPRTLPQAIHLANLIRVARLPEPIVLHLDVPDETVVGRLTARRQCPHCLRIYNLKSMPPEISDSCDDCGAALITRPDDQEAVIRDRLRAYAQQTGPILQWYGPRIVRRIDGSQSPEAVAQAIERAVYCLRVVASEPSSAMRTS